MQRHAIGILALLLLAGAVALADAPGHETIQAACVRVGTVLAMLWLAYPDVVRWPAWTFGAIPVLLILLAVRPRWFLYLLPVLIAVALLRPRRR